MKAIKTLTIDEMEDFLYDVYLDGFADGRKDDEVFLFDKAWLCSAEFPPIIKTTL